ncbi:MAG TPA: DUF3732 domain-containing protein [Candidatus Acidoferrales bacterium]|nr:DUF3732 domain-containing protein [Candidatus Acidoferrales bacterium]
MLTTGELDLFVARPEPGLDNASSYKIHLVEGVDLDDLPFKELRGNTDVKQLNEILTRYAGIGENLFSPPEGQTRKPLEATVRHALKLCFQAQGEVTNRYYLFHRQEDNWIAQSLKDSLPYFLGITPAERISLEKVLRRLQFELRQLDAEEVDGRQLALVETSIQKELVAEAIDVGLISPQQANDDAIELLKSALEEEDMAWGPDSDLNAGLRQLQDERQALRERYKDKRSEIELLKSFLHEGDAFTRVLLSEEGRLYSAEILPSVATGIQPSDCPLCGNHVEEQGAITTQIMGDLEDIRSQIVGAVGHDSKLTKLLASKEDDLERLRAELRSNLHATERLTARSDEYLSRQSEYLSTSRVKGRISFYLDRLADSDAIQTAEAKRHGLQLKIDSALDRLRTLDDPDRASEIETNISSSMSEYAKRIRFEWKNAQLKLDIKKLTVEAKAGGSDILMKEMGSAENHLACHLISHFAIHRLFVRTNRPVPRFLFLDQPTQVYYPPELDMDSGKTEHLDNEDSQGVHGIFSLFYRFSKELADDFQLIVIDHADLADSEFQDALLERWREGAKLVPASWYESEGQ